MTTVMDYIFKRRSIRRYQEKPVEKEKIDQLLQAGMAAPSAANNRPLEFVIVTNDESAKFHQVLRYGKFYVPAAIVECANPEIGSARPSSFDYWVQDCSTAAQNILLAAVGLGLA